MTFKKGHPGGPGRPKGSTNITPRKLVEMILQAVEEKGGVEYLKTLDDRTLSQLVGRVVPKNVQIGPEGTTWEEMIAAIVSARGESVPGAR